MKLINSKILLPLLFMALMSCDKNWLDKKPEKNLTVPETLKDFEALLDNSDLNSFSALSLGEVSSDGYYVLESRWATGFSDNYSNAFTWSNERPYRRVLDWNEAYQSILTSNVILDGLEKIEENQANMVQRNRVRGGALFNRARHFFELSQIFCVPYSVSSASSDLGLPLRFEADITTKVVRSTVQETYNMIISDLIKAKDILPEIPQYKTRASKTAVFAQLARVYLNMREYSKAGLYADSSIQLSGTLKDYNNVSPVAANIGIFNEEVIFHSVSCPYNIMTSSGFIDDEIYNLYEVHDLRRTRFFRVNSNGTIVFKGNYHSSSSTMFFGLATDEMYLIRAECFIRSGKIIDAMADINYLLKMRWDHTVPFSPRIFTNAADALKMVLEERKKELIRRGQRWSDLRRLNFEPQLALTINRTIGGNTYVLKPGSYKYTFPIPDDVIELSDIPQNTGWINK